MKSKLFTMLSIMALFSAVQQIQANEGPAKKKFPIASNECLHDHHHYLYTFKHSIPDPIEEKFYKDYLFIQKVLTEKLTLLNESIHNDQTEFKKSVAVALELIEKLHRENNLMVQKHDKLLEKAKILTEKKAFAILKRDFKSVSSPEDHKRISREYDRRMSEINDFFTQLNDLIAKASAERKKGIPSEKCVEVYNPKSNYLLEGIIVGIVLTLVGQTCLGS